jgi:hypothetical protein
VEPQNPSQTWGSHPSSTHGGDHEFDLDFKWEQRKFKKNQKKGKPGHGVMICDLVPRKIPNMSYQHFKEKLFTKNGTKEDFTWLYPIEPGFCKLHSKLSNIDPIFGRDVNISIAYNFCNQRFFELPHKKWIFHFISDQKGQNRWFFVKWLPSALYITPPLQFLMGE